MQPNQRRGRPASLMVFLTLALLLGLLAAYVGVMHAIVDVSRIGGDHDANERDAAYSYLHLVFLAGSAAIGFGAGKWLNGLGIAFGTLFVIVVAVGMLAVQLSSYSLACHGHNDIVRHWQCD
ncbi:MAG: hypothetical protein IPI85_06305 [Dehalococcoidia bacterium]|uniref:hypothetical protein n=1 Tax=Candidatus Amarobacter glycogenicus TaxID=3140699 RepID=UPI00313588E5|nr:hypothetical protein [Dehalococcoidia bacterium]MBK7125812.1 hypothetical protein [Dehalococcoidia bacterium]MBK7328694.1 hypothetical protein [Dehalococcoidia bacterium]MBK8559388.1 hypothetical protein [Dehalococcoidia bacterium]